MAGNQLVTALILHSLETHASAVPVKGLVQNDSGVGHTVTVSSTTNEERRRRLEAIQQPARRLIEVRDSATLTPLSKVGVPSKLRDGPPRPSPTTLDISLPSVA